MVITYLSNWVTFLSNILISVLEIVECPKNEFVIEKILGLPWWRSG